MVRGQSLTTLRAAALENGTAVLGGHPGAEAVLLGTTTVVRLIGSLRHNC